jgi:hypothetical protein
MLGGPKNSVWMIALYNCTLRTLRRFPRRNSTYQNVSILVKRADGVGVTLRPTVSRSVRLGVLEQVTRCYIYLSDNYFLYFSRRAPSLTRGLVCNLQFNDASSISSYIATDGLSASSSWCRAQILISLFDSYFVISVQGSLTHILMNRVVQPTVKVRSQTLVSDDIRVYSSLPLTTK